MDKSKYRMQYQKSKKRKLFKVLLIIMIISVILGFFYVAVISNADKILLKSSFNDFFKSNTFFFGAPA